MNQAVLVLENGQIFSGQAWGAIGQTLGEAVFCTAMTGYQETLTDPSYHRQIVVATAPQIGNTGWNTEDGESTGSSGSAGIQGDSGKIWVAGYAARNPSRRVSSWRATTNLDAELASQNIVSIAGIDTRTIVRTLRDHGSMRAGIFSGPALAAPEELITRVQNSPSMKGANLSAEVSTTEMYTVEPQAGAAVHTVAAIDLGIKTNTPRMFAERGIRVHVLPATATIADIQALDVDGVFLSNGPGDPATATGTVELTSAILRADLPLFGICFGNQILGRALGRNTYKMKFGHRGINIPVLEKRTGKVSITAQNHGFALEGEAGEEFDTEFGRAAVSHICANDGTVEGVELLSGRAFSVQYHPEAAAGPHDAAYLFDRFSALMRGEISTQGAHQ